MIKGVGCPLRENLEEEDLAEVEDLVEVGDSLPFSPRVPRAIWSWKVRTLPPPPLEYEKPLENGK